MIMVMAHECDGDDVGDVDGGGGDYGDVDGGFYPI